MIRVNGRKDQPRGFMVVIPPQLRDQLLTGEPVVIDLQRGHEDIVPVPYGMVLYVPGDEQFARLASKIAADAAAQGIAGTEIGGAPATEKQGETRQTDHQGRPPVRGRGLRVLPRPAKRPRRRQRPKRRR